MRIGHGYDVHAFGSGDHIMLGGVRIEHDRGLVAHSDGDVLIHAICDALLGAIGEGDIGHHFPDTDQRWQGADSRTFLREIVELVHERDYAVANIDTTVITESPKLAPFLDDIRTVLAGDLRVASGQVNVKATTSEGLGFIGRGEGVAAQAIVLLLGQ